MTTGNLASLLEDAARRHPDREAVVQARTRLTYTEVDQQANAVANLLRSVGVEPGDKVALSCPNVAAFPVVYYGILKAGAVVVPLNVLLKSREVAYHLADSDAVVYFCFEDTPDLPMCTEGRRGFSEVPGCEHLFVITDDRDAPSPVAGAETLGQAVAPHPTSIQTVPTNEDDTAVILYTSGTTGQPKGAELRHRNLRDNALLSASVFGSDASRPDTYLGVLPLFHSYGQTCIQNSAFAYGGTIVMQPRFDARDALDLIAAERITFFAGVPTMYWQLLGALEERDDVAALARNLRVAASGGAALPVEVHRQFEATFGVTIMEGYGLSETSPVASFTPWGADVKPGSIGRPVDGVEMKVIGPDWEEINRDGANPDAVGEIAIKGHNVMKGYYRRPEATTEALRDGWFRTGDLARRDLEGWYYIVDRVKDLIIRGGYNVYPREIEEVLYTHPDVSLAAVVGVPHESHGQEIKAFLIPRPGASLTEAEVVAWARARMAAYKYPRIVEFVDELPMTATRKILKRHLVQSTEKS